MVSISAALDQIKLTVSSGIRMELVEPLCQEMGLEYRNTILTPPKTILYLAKQVIMGPGDLEPEESEGPQLVVIDKTPFPPFLFGKPLAVTLMSLVPLCRLPWEEADRWRTAYFAAG